jgi:hypothetical protein
LIYVFVGAAPLTGMTPKAELMFFGGICPMPCAGLPFLWLIG